MAINVLYISYDGIMEPIGQSQVWRYLKFLSKEYRIFLVSFEKPNDLRDKKRFLQIRKEMKNAGVSWKPLRYHRAPTVFSTLYDVLRGFFTCFFIVIFYRIPIVHTRSYIPSVIALALKKIFKIRFIFDMRGFWAEERLEIGQLSATSGTYRALKWLEKRFIQEADIIISLTMAAVNTIKGFSYLKGQSPVFKVIPTCADLDIFYPVKKKPSENSAFTLMILGNVRTFYMFGEMLDCFKILMKLKTNSRLVIINRSDHDFIKQSLITSSIPRDRVILKSAEHKEVAEEIRHATAGIFLIKPTYSKTASMPTKLAEFLACGIPCLTNYGIGDSAAILEGSRTGIVLKDFKDDTQEDAVKRLLTLTEEPDIEARCSGQAREYFSLAQGVESYGKIYSQLGNLL